MWVSSPAECVGGTPLIKTHHLFPCSFHTSGEGNTVGQSLDNSFNIHPPLLFDIHFLKFILPNLNTLCIPVTPWCLRFANLFHHISPLDHYTPILPYFAFMGTFLNFIFCLIINLLLYIILFLVCLFKSHPNSTIANGFLLIMFKENLAITYFPLSLSILLWWFE